MKKSFWKSKINWVAMITLVLGFVTDPKFLGYVDPFWSAQILKVSGILAFVIRTWFTNPES